MENIEKKSVLMRRFVLAMFFSAAIAVGCDKSEVQLPDARLNTAEESFELKSWSIDGKEVNDQQLDFSPNEELLVNASYLAHGSVAFKEAVVYLTYVTSSENLRTIAGECKLQPISNSDGVRTVSGTLKMPPDHMVEFMQKYTTEEYFDCVIKDGDRVVAQCRIGFKE